MPSDGAASAAASAAAAGLGGFAGGAASSARASFGPSCVGVGAASAAAGAASTAGAGGGPGRSRKQARMQVLVSKAAIPGALAELLVEWVGEGSMAALAGLTPEALAAYAEQRSPGLLGRLGLVAHSLASALAAVAATVSARPLPPPTGGAAVAAGQRWP
jgi:hypothetical protein